MKVFKELFRRAFYALDARSVQALENQNPRQEKTLPAKNNLTSGPAPEKQHHWQASVAKEKPHRQDCYLPLESQNAIFFSGLPR